MKPLAAKASRTISARPDVIFSVLADVDRHVQILPADNFKDVEVLDRDSGSVSFTFDMMGFSERMSVRLAEVREPEFLAQVSSDADAPGQRTEITLEPVGDGTKVTISSVFQRDLNPVVRRFASQGIGKIYEHELDLLEKAVHDQGQT
jgi:polyketide cyclase/dehydrase/lipid transport protein